MFEHPDNTHHKGNYHCSLTGLDLTKQETMLFLCALNQLIPNQSNRIFAVQ